MNTILYHDLVLTEEIQQTPGEESKAVIQRFFDLAHLHEVKEILNEIKEQLLTNSFNHSEDSIQYSNTIYFFERLEQLVEAAYVLR